MTNKKWREHLAETQKMLDVALDLDGRAQCEPSTEDEPYDYTKIVADVDEVHQSLLIGLTHSIHEVHFCRHLDREGDCHLSCVDEGIGHLKQALYSLESIKRAIENTLK